MRFQAKHPEEVVVGGGRFAKAAKVERDTILQEFIKNLEQNDAGVIYLEKDDDPEKVKALLRRASHITGIGIRSSWDDEKKPTKLGWKRNKQYRLAA